MIVDKIDESVYSDWKRHPCTKKLYEILDDKIKNCAFRMCLPSVVLDPNNKESARTLGKLEAFDKINTLSLDDFKTETKEERKDA